MKATRPCHFCILPMLASCEPKKPTTMSEKPAAMPEVPAGAETATLGAGCYWCIEAAYRQLDGVHSVTSGFMGGQREKPDLRPGLRRRFRPRGSGAGGLRSKKISFEKILAWFWDLHDPTTLNRQGNDVGTQYRSAIFYHSDAQKKTAEASKAAAAKNFKDPIVTEITKASEFYPAPE
jgi:peptide-methionine (S)-S-oxide reductase